MSNNQKRIDRAEEMIRVIARDIKMGRSETGYRYIKQRYRVGMIVAKEARKLAGVKAKSKKQIAAHARSRVGRPPKTDPVPVSEMMYRPNGVNPLTMAWV